jgi:hypothetical protein
MKGRTPIYVKAHVAVNVQGPTPKASRCLAHILNSAVAMESGLPYVKGQTAKVVRRLKSDCIWFQHLSVRERQSHPDINFKNMKIAPIPATTLIIALVTKMPATEDNMVNKYILGLAWLSQNSLRLKTLTANMHK